MHNSGYLLGQKDGKFLNTLAIYDCLVTTLQSRLVSQKKLSPGNEGVQKCSDEHAFNTFFPLNVKFRHPLFYLVMC